MNHVANALLVYAANYPTMLAAYEIGFGGTVTCSEDDCMTAHG